MTINPKSAFDKVTATEYNELLRLAQPPFVRTTGTDTNASTTVKSHPTLTLTPDINSTYTFTAWLVVNAPAAQDFKVQWLTPASSAGWWTAKNTAQGGTSGTIFQSSITWANPGVLEGAGGDLIYEIFGVLRTAATPGAFTMQYAPFVAGTVTVQIDSTLELRKR